MYIKVLTTGIWSVKYKEKLIAAAEIQPPRIFLRLDARGASQPVAAQPGAKKRKKTIAFCTAVTYNCFNVLKEQKLKDAMQ